MNSDKKIHEHYEKMFDNCPLNVEITLEKELEKFTAIKAIWGLIFASIGLVVWNLRNPHDLSLLD